MKKVLTVLFSSLIVLLMFAGSGNPVQAKKADCDCEGLLTGSERNKIVSDIIKTDVFKNLKSDQKGEGFVWGGAAEILVAKPIESVTIVVIPFTNKDGITKVAGFRNGELIGVEVSPD
jgi:hypothetical protein